MDRRIVLVMHTTSYGAARFSEACGRAGAAVAFASDRCHVLDRAWHWPDDSLVIDFSDPEAAATIIATASKTRGAPVRAVLPVGGELPARVAAAAASQLGLVANQPAAMIAAGNKLVMRQRLAAAGAAGACATDAARATSPSDGGDDPDLCQPRFQVISRAADTDEVAAAVTAPGGVGFPCVIKPLMLSGSRGVIRADDPATLAVAFTRLARLLDDPALRKIDPEAAQRILIESFVKGPEVAIEALLTNGELDVLALFDKPDPLDGPFFEETLYITPSRLPTDDQRRLARATAAAARALGLVTGAIHAELRLGPAGPVIIEVAARPIGGLCSRSLRFEGALTLEDVVVRHALGHGTRPPRDPRPSGVMMIPIPTRVPAVLKAVGGVAAALEVPGVSDVVISTRVGETVVPLPEGSSYLGFIFALGDSPGAVESALRVAAQRLQFTFATLIPVDRKPVLQHR